MDVRIMFGILYTKACCYVGQFDDIEHDDDDEHL